MQVRHDGVVGIWGGFGSCGKPAGEKGFFAEHVDGAVDESRFARDLEADHVGKEGGKCLVQDPV